MPRAVPSELQAAIKATYDSLLKTTGGQRRRGQQQMIGLLARAACNAKKSGEEGSAERFCVIEAPTGSGKSFAYTTGVLPVALRSDLKTIISVSTVALQEQLVARDLVVMQQVLPDLRVALAKGRGRFACPIRMEQCIGSGVPAGGAATTLLQALKADTWSGDVDELPQPPVPAEWQAMTNDRLGCTGRKCPQYNGCPYYAARARIHSANVIVVNHALLLADVAAGNVILPPLEDCVLVIDEGHHFPAQALQSLAGGHALGDAQASIREASSVMAAVRRVHRAATCGRLAATVGDHLNRMGGALDEARMAIESMGQTTEARDPTKPVRFKSGRLPAWLQSAAQGCKDAATEARNAMSDLMNALMDDDTDVADEVQQRLVSDLGRVIGRIDRIAAVWNLMVAETLDHAPVAKWIEVEDGDLRVCASPVGVGQYLRDTVWSKVAAAAVVSATVCTTGGFAPFMRESGLDGMGDGVNTLQVDSPFDYERQACIVVRKGMASAKNAEAHTAYLIEQIPEDLARLQGGQGALVLFVSWKQLREVSAAMPEWVQQRTLSQDTMSRAEMLKRHEEAIRAGEPSFLFGTAALEEGLDLRGDLCKLVILSKLPFSPAQDPVAETHAEHLENLGRSHFAEVVVPHACRRLAQATGRLIRSETDTGHIIINDSRLMDTRFGREMLATLPPYRIAREFPV